MDLHIGLSGRGLADQIYRQIRAVILDGRLRPGEALPSTRELASRLSVSRNTVCTAYDRLVAEGYLCARAGARTYVSDGIRTSLGDRPRPAASAVQPRTVWAAQPEPLDMSIPDEAYDFRPGVPDSRGFPFATWRALLADTLRASTAMTTSYGDPAGHPELRQAIARHIGVSRAVRVAADDVLVTSGIQQALDLIGRVLIEPGDVVAVEDPGWLPARSLFQTLGAQVVGVRVDAEGLVVADLPARARMVYVSPSHQFPIGVAMSLPRRLDLLAWAERTGAVVVEDDYDSEFRYAGRPLEPLHSLDQSARVVYVGSFSKTLLPSLRMGFCIPPPSLFPALRKAKYLLDWHTALPLQAALATFIDRGLLARHIRRMRRVYQDRRDRLYAALHRHFADVLDPLPSVAGLHLGARLLDQHVDDRAVVDRAAAAGVHLPPWSDFAMNRPVSRGLLIGYGRIPADRIEDGLAVLRQCLDSVRRGSTVRVRNQVPAAVTNS